MASIATDRGQIPVQECVQQHQTANRLRSVAALSHHTAQKNAVEGFVRQRPSQHWICTRTADDTNLWLTPQQPDDQESNSDSDDTVPKRKPGKAGKRKCHQLLALIQRLSIRRIGDMGDENLETAQLHCSGQVLPKAGRVWGCVCITTICCYERCFHVISLAGQCDDHIRQISSSCSGWGRKIIRSAWWCFAAGFS